MPSQSVGLRNAKLNAGETFVGTTPILRVRVGTTLPTTEQGAATGALLAEGTLPSDWQAAASGGAKAINGTYSLTGVADGTAGHYELFMADGTTRVEAGTCGGPGSGRELILDSTGGVIANGQAVTVTAWTYTAGNAW